MKLVEIKNSLARLNYEPSDFPLILSDFLTIDDGNQKIIAQVVSIESTNIDITNCALLSFAMDLNDDGSFETYNGYVPSLDALVSKTKPEIIQQIFAGQESNISIGKITNSTNTNINLSSSLIDNFLYIQSDRFDETKRLLKKILNFNIENNKNSLLIDFEGINKYKIGNTLQVGLDFKLPINIQVLNYIYENDLSGLTVEQKVIIQDILLDIQEYINSIEDNFIPFKTLLNVINDIYQTDKSLGIVLFRNKLLKYNQLNIFATNKEEFLSLDKSLKENVLTILNLNGLNEKWQREFVNFALSFIEKETNVIFEVKDESLTTEILNKVYKSEKIKPIITSKYDSEFATQLKSFAKNLILFKPLLQQKAFATYNSFFDKISQNECIISGEATYFTPLIVKELNTKFTLNNAIKFEFSIDKDESILKIDNPTNNNQELNKELAEAITLEIAEDEIDEIEVLEDTIVVEENSYQTSNDVMTEEINNIEETVVTLEDEIAKDVDKIFYAETVDSNDNLNTDEKIITESTNSNIDYDEMFKDVDMDLLDSLNDETTNTTLQNTNEDIDNDFIDIASLADDADIIQETIETPIIEERQSSTYQEQLNKQEKTILPIYSSEINEDQDKNETKINVAEGNIVFHEKYGRGVVEQIIEYGKKTLCSIQFDNVGRRLLDPTLADLKQI